MQYIFNNYKLKNRRQDLRVKSTNAEQILWQLLRNKKLGYKFLRQYSIEGYVVDFYCAEKRLAIEIDGGYHHLADSKKYDSYRQRLISAYNIKFMRFSNDRISSDVRIVLAEITMSLS